MQLIENLAVAMFAVGGIFIAVAIIGGGVEAGSIRIPVIPMISRWALGVFGSLLMLAPVSTPIVASLTSNTPASVKSAPNKSAVPEQVRFTIETTLGKDTNFGLYFVVVDGKILSELEVRRDGNNQDEVFFSTTPGRKKYSIRGASVLIGKDGVQEVVSVSGKGEFMATEGQVYAIRAITIGDERRWILEPRD